jgi:succinyl-CoA synthetase beta subunit
MKIHEYQAKQIFSTYNIPTPKEIVCSTLSEIEVASKEIGFPLVIKAQVLVGGRGKAGGVKLAKNNEDVTKYGAAILGMDIKGLPVEKVLVAEAIDIQSEVYLGLTIDRKTKSIIVMVSKEGGVEIEEVAKQNPKAILTFPIDVEIGMTSFMARKIAFSLFNQPELVKQMTQLVKQLYQVFIEHDASLVEINPLVITGNQGLLALDAKMDIDDNAMYRQIDIAKLNPPTHDEVIEQDAKKKGLTYIALDGNIGCIVNGAGLAMATMDVIHYFGGNPANFLDIGGSSNPQKMIDAMQLLTSNPKVEVIMINIFGGITRCDDVANGLVTALNQMNIQVPIVIRLSGTNAEAGLEILKQLNLPIVGSLSEAAQEAIRIVSKK